MIERNSVVKGAEGKIVEGVRIKLVYMNDVQAPPIGTGGTVIGVDDVGSILVKWDNGCSLNLIPETDEYEIID